MRKTPRIYRDENADLDMNEIECESDALPSKNLPVIEAALAFLETCDNVTHFDRKRKDLARKVNRLKDECVKQIKDKNAGERPQLTLDALAEVMSAVHELKARELLRIKLLELHQTIYLHKQEQNSQRRNKLSGEANNLRQQINALVETINLVIEAAQPRNDSRNQAKQGEEGEENSAKITLDKTSLSTQDNISKKIRELNATINTLNTETLPNSLKNLYEVSHDKTKNKIGSIAMLAGTVIGAVVGICAGLILPPGLPGVTFGGIAGAFVGASIGALAANTAWKLGEIAERNRFFGVKKGDFSLANLSRDVGDIVNTLGTPQALADSGEGTLAIAMATAASPY